jgi:hypothetical protein
MMYLYIYGLIVAKNILRPKLSAMEIFAMWRNE